MELRALLAELDQLNLPTDQYIITSSGSLAARGIREAHDLDIVPSDTLWEKLKSRYPVRRINFKTINIGNIQILGPGSYFRNSAIATPQQQIETADIIDGYKYLNLALLRKFKEALGRDKDLKDVELIDQYLESHNS